jgi:group 4 capsule polysaccharide lipoprotein GfcB/YjbF
MKKPLVLMTALGVFLAACSSADRDMPMIGMLSSKLKTLGKKPDTAGMRRAVESLTREQLIGVAKDPLILVDIETSQQYATLNQVSRNGVYAVFQSGDQKTLTFSKGLLSATRGLGADLMALDVSQTLGALQSRTTSTVTQRRHRMLNAGNGLDTVNYTCQFSGGDRETLTSINKQLRLLKYTENCRQNDTEPDAGLTAEMTTQQREAAKTYTNTYWIDPATRIIWKSRQWGGPVIGYLGIEVLIPEKP